MQAAVYALRALTSMGDHVLPDFRSHARVLLEIAKTMSCQMQAVFFEIILPHEIGERQADAFLTKHVNAATQRVWGMLYNCSNLVLAIAFVEAKKRGVDVRLILDESQLPTAADALMLLRNAKIEIRVATNVDGVDGRFNRTINLLDDKMVSGSASITERMTANNVEDIWLIGGGIVPKYCEVFVNTWSSGCEPFARKRIVIRSDTGEYCVADVVGRDEDSAEVFDQGSEFDETEPEPATALPAHPSLTVQMPLTPQQPVAPRRNQRVCSPKRSRTAGRKRLLPEDYNGLDNGANQKRRRVLKTVEQISRVGSVPSSHSPLTTSSSLTTSVSGRIADIKPERITPASEPAMH